jgi:hypothetical protein
MDEHCVECHREYIHDEIENQNIHIVGGSSGGTLNTPDNDPDAYSPSWKAGN